MVAPQPSTFSSSPSSATRFQRGLRLRGGVALLLLASCGKEPSTEQPGAEPATPAPASPARAERSASAVTITGSEPYDSAELGGLHGTILFAGEAPERFALGASTMAECKHHADVDQRANVLIVNDGKLANAYVGIDAGYDRARIPPVPADAVTLEQKGCMYLPRVLALRVGQTLRVTNDDPTSHNVHTRAKRNDALNRNMGKGQSALEFRFEKPEKPVPFACDIHPWMGAAVYVEEHPWFALTDEQGSFRIRDLPPGEYVVEVAHEALRKASGKVKVEAGKSAGITLTLSK